MYRPFFVLILLLTFELPGFESSVAAQEQAPERPAARNSAELIAQAEAAYENLLVEDAEALAERALEAGDNPPRRLQRIYRLIGLASAAANDMGRARDAYLRLLAIDPAAPVDTTVSPRLREPFFQARAYWTADRRPFGMDVKLHPNGAIQLTLEDPLTMVEKVRLYVRYPAGEGRFTAHQITPKEVSSVVVPDYTAGRPVDMYLVLHDTHGNMLLTKGSQAAPETLTTPLPQSGGAFPGGIAVDDDGSTIFESPWFWLVVGVVAAGAGVTAYLLTLEPERSGQFGVMF